MYFFKDIHPASISFTSLLKGDFSSKKECALSEIFQELSLFGRISLLGMQTKVICFPAKHGRQNTVELQWLEL